MKKKYTDILKESLINFDDVQKNSSTVEDIVNFKGKGSLPTHKKANNVVSVLEKMYFEEDNDISMVSEMEETEIASGEGPTDKINPDVKDQKLGDLQQADGVAHPSPQKTDEFEDTI